MRAKQCAELIPHDCITIVMVSNRLILYRTKSYRIVSDHTVNVASSYVIEVPASVEAEVIAGGDPTGNPIGGRMEAMGRERFMCDGKISDCCLHWH